MKKNKNIGCGKGRLSNFLGQKQPEATFIGIDRQNFRYKLDKLNDSFIRIGVDLADLDLSGINIIQESSKIGKKIVGYSKHLCGGATDLGIRCMANTLPSDISSFEALFIATCCHNKSDWNIYTGKESFIRWGLSEDDFKILRCLSGWATDGRKHLEEKKAKKQKLSHPDQAQEKENIKTRDQLHFTLEQKEEIGKK